MWFELSNPDPVICDQWSRHVTRKVVQNTTSLFFLHAHVWVDSPLFLANMPSLLFNFLVTFSSSWLDVNSIIYKKGAIVVLAAEEDDLQHVVAVNVNHCYFIVVILHTMCFKPHFHEYEVEHPSIPEYVVVHLTELVDHHPLGLYTCTVSDQCQKLVSLKYHVTS